MDLEETRAVKGVGEPAPGLGCMQGWVCTRILQSWHSQLKRVDLRPTREQRHSLRRGMRA